MLQAVSSDQDVRHESQTRKSVKRLVAAQNDNKTHLLLGSVVPIKLLEIIKALSGYSNLSIRVVLAASATDFLGGQTPERPRLSDIANLPNVDAIYQDADEWGPSPWHRGAPILHIELRRWADLLVIAPLSVNTMAKIVGGMCDDLLTSLVRAWDTTGAIDGRRKRIVVAPAADTAMWQHPITERQLRVLEEEWGGEGGWFDVLRPQEKLLADGDTEIGVMKDWREIVVVIEEKLNLRK